MLDLRRVFGFVALTVFLPALSVGQSFNIDMDTFGGSAATGNGAPSASFGAAAGQPGFWNRIYAVGPETPKELINLQGQSTGVMMQASGGTGFALGYNNQSNTGDFAFLLNDCAEVMDIINYDIVGVQNGLYRVYTYAVRPAPGSDRATVTVAGALGPNPQIVQGSMPGNSFEFLVTHSLHEVDVVDGTLSITVSEEPGFHAFVNGFQVVLVPEPSGLVCLGMAGALCLLRRK